MIGIIGAMDVEISLLLSQLQNEKITKINDYEFHEGLLNNQDVVIVKCGVGKVNAAIVATILSLKFNCKLVISTGIAGGIKPLKTKDVLLGSEFIYGDFDIRFFGYEYGQVPNEPQYFKADSNYLLKAETILKELKVNYHKGVCATSDKFITSMDNVLIPTENRYVATEMESTAIVHALKHANIPVLVLRFISDIIGEESQIENYFEFETEMANLSAEITFKFLGELWNIMR